MHTQDTSDLEVTPLDSPIRGLLSVEAASILSAIESEPYFRWTIGALAGFIRIPDCDVVDAVYELLGVDLCVGELLGDGPEYLCIRSLGYEAGAVQSLARTTVAQIAVASTVERRSQIPMFAGALPAIVSRGRGSARASRAG